MKKAFDVFVQEIIYICILLYSEGRIKLQHYSWANRYEASLKKYESIPNSKCKFKYVINAKFKSLHII